MGDVFAFGSAAVPPEPARAVRASATKTQSSGGFAGPRPLPPSAAPGPWGDLAEPLPEPPISAAPTPRLTLALLLHVNLDVGRQIGDLLTFDELRALTSITRGVRRSGLRGHLLSRSRVQFPAKSPRRLARYCAHLDPYVCGFVRELSLESGLLWGHDDDDDDDDDDAVDGRTARDRRGRGGGPFVMSIGGPEIDYAAATHHYPNVERLNYNGIRPLDIGAIASFPRLRALYIRGNMAIPNIAHLLDLRDRLEELSFTAACIGSPEDLACLAEFPRLRVLELRTCDEIRTLRPLVALADRLEVLRVSSTRLHDLRELEQLTNLREIEITQAFARSIPLAAPTLLRASFRGLYSLQDLTFLAAAPALRELDLANTGVTDVAALTFCVELEKLVVSAKSDGTIVDYSVLATLPRLRDIRLEVPARTSQRIDMLPLLGAFPALRKPTIELV